MKYSYNLNCFKTITSESAYFLGLLYADGNISDKGKVCINLNNKDLKILEDFKNFLQTDKPIFKNTKTNSISFSFQNKILSNDLKKLGLIPRKSLIIKYPEIINSEFHKDFIRGYFDGDGSVCLKMTKNFTRIRVHFVGTSEILSSIQNILIANINLTKTKISNITKDKNTYQLCINRQLDIINLKNYLYNDSNLYLERKFNIFNTNIDEKNINSNNSSKYKNVLYRKSRNHWRAVYRINGIRKEKIFKTEDEAFLFLKQL